jgi:DNA-binding response OmpR family regulator
MLKVMIIDSESHFVRTVGEELKKDYALLTCENGSRALQLCQTFSPDAVVLDPLTPGFGPGNFITRMKSQSTKPWVQVVVVSYAALIRQIEESFDWGADYYFFKPVLPIRIRFKVRELLGRNKPYLPNPHPGRP